MRRTVTNLEVKARVHDINEMEEVIKKVSEYEKEHSCNCTLLSIELNKSY